MLQNYAILCKFRQIIFYWCIMTHEKENGKKTGSVRFDADSFDYICSLAAVNNRSKTGEAAWLVKIVIRLQRDHPEVYNQITNKLNHGIFNSNS